MSDWLASAEGQRVLRALTVVSVWFFFCVAIALNRYRRQRRLSMTVGNSETPLLLCYASQTGFALRLAMQTAQSLQATGQTVRLQSLGDTDFATLTSAPRVLFVVSTTGEGDPPDTAIKFVRKVMGNVVDLHGMHYGLLALGDHSYRHYCGFGRELDRWLRRCGAQPLFDVVEVDNADDGALRHWQHHLEILGNRQPQPDWNAPRYRAWNLVERRLLNPDSLGGPVFHLALKSAPEMPQWRAGDIAEIGPHNSPLQVSDALQVLGLPAELRLLNQDREETLSHYLACSLLPRDLEELRGASLEQLLQRLKPLPHREYSIASVHEDGQLDLLLRQMRQADGQLGLGSGWLTQHAEMGAEIALRIRENPSFHSPDSGPLILIGNGTGMAGLRAHIKARVAAGQRRNWLLFGERSADHDYFYREEIERWQISGFLPRLDLTFSRDQTERIYIQQRIRERADELRRWVSEGASIYVCGSLQGMAPAVTAALNDILGAAQLEQLMEDRRYRRDVY